MKKANLVLMAALAAAGVVSVSAALLAPAPAVAAEEKKAEPQKVGTKIRKPLAAAQDAVQAKNWEAASAALAEAAAVPPTTAYEKYLVDELGWFVKLQQKDYPGAIQALERAVESGFVAPEEMPQRYKALAQLNYETKNYAKAVEYGNKAIAASPENADLGAMVAHSLYMQQDYAGARATVDRLTAGSAKPDEQLLLIGLRSSYELKDRAGTMKSLESLVRYYPQQKYWEDLLSNQLYETKGDREMRTLYRLMSDTGTIDKPEEYSEAATVLMSGGFPTEAKAVLERGLAANVFQGEAATRAKAELQRASSAADADRKDLPGADAALAAAKTGNAMVATGKLYFSMGEYAKAADAIVKGLAAGGVTDVDDANTLLGIAYARTDKYAEANAAFAAVKDAKLNEVNRLWKLYVETQQAPAGA